MAVPVTTPPVVAPTEHLRPVRARHFVRLKLRVTRNNLRGQSWRVALFVLGVFFGLWFAVGGFFLFAAPGLADGGRYAILAGALGGGLVTLGWLVLPLVFFGVDETLDPARFALLPLSRRTLVTGLCAAALVSVPMVAALVAFAGLVLTAGLLGGWAAAVVSVLGVLSGLLLCVAGSRALTSAFATMLRSRRVRDLAAVLLAVLAAMLAPIQLALTAALRDADWDRLLGIARVVGWTPLGAPWSAGIEVAEGRAWAAALKLLITGVSVAALLLWWSRSLESAMTGTASAGAAPARRGPAGTAVARLFPRPLGWLGRTRFGALVARECRYWWRDARRRANLITLVMVGIFVPVMINVGGAGFVFDSEQGFSSAGPTSPLTASVSMVFVGVLAAVTLANQFGFDGSAYAANVVAGVPGRVELQARMVAFSAYVVPLLGALSAVMVLVLGEPAWIGLTLGVLFATYGGGLAVNSFLSVLGAYSLPETSNPFAMNTGAGIARSMLTLVSMIVSAVVAIPMLVAAVLLGDAWYWFALPVGVAYGVGAAWLGAYLAGDVLDRRMPELLATVTPRR
ncbi:ABC transporter permease [Micromonospora sp. WMMA1923]|uniref:ABC transporter permease n=1 Tax=Micromonospora sp. WMMA1923 TaxID=3404125 RepID=UPI003B94F287